MVRSALEYVSVTWWPSAARPLAHLESIQHKFTRFALCFWSVQVDYDSRCTLLDFESLTLNLVCTPCVQRYLWLLLTRYMARHVLNASRESCPLNVEFTNNKYKIDLARFIFLDTTTTVVGPGLTGPLIALAFSGLLIAHSRIVSQSHTLHFLGLTP